MQQIIHRNLKPNVINIFLFSLLSFFRVNFVLNTPHDICDVIYKQILGHSVPRVIVIATLRHKISLLTTKLAAQICYGHSYDLVFVLLCAKREKMAYTNWIRSDLIRILVGANYGPLEKIGCHSLCGLPVSFAIFFALFNSLNSIANKCTEQKFNYSTSNVNPLGWTAKREKNGIFFLLVVLLFRALSYVKTMFI